MISTVASTGSTNADLLLLAQQGAPEGNWLRAERQTGGRGRLGRVWASPPGNLYASTLVRVRPADPDPGTLALVVGIAVEEVASAYAGAGKLSLKWPNDVMAGAAKVAGILLERVGDAVVIGIGVNLAHHPQDLGRPATSLAALGAAAPDPAIFLADLSTAMARWLSVWRGQGVAPVRLRWLDRAHPIGTVLAASLPTGPVEGLFDGLEQDGALRLRRSDGVIESIRAGDVFLM